MAVDRTAQLAASLAAHRAVFDGLLEATADLDAGRWATPTGCPGWDVHDQLAHVIGLERRLLGDDELDPDVVVPDLPHLATDVDRFIERDVEARRRLSGGELRTEAAETFARRLDALGSLQPADLEVEVDSVVGRRRLATVLRMRLFDLTSHERDVRAALLLPPPDGPHVEAAAEQLVRAWERLLPERVDTAGTVVLAVAGIAPLVVDLTSGETGRDTGDGRDVALRVDLAPDVALAIGGGRRDAPGVDGFPWDGDPAVLTAVLDGATVTF